ncbi:hypothetical protein G6N05_07995 [Flavobacterium sp. F372]|uniref:Uncharacterized protein n=1 Tax=Flavobacterium bernardetii TaxID=2813823 RepID=A0ABR7IX14_9FLAO|nr:hypothetical protein [Flavobacterium bernardetii]MBC5834313.1 hypothetical protein [Flavobacterium bernardetii]NHF70048.1 hypothetical protein [Flavobacterium bernardetii]
MEILINELSLHGQFNNIEEFINTSLNKFVKIYSLLEKQNIYPLKNYNFYNLNITQNQTFNFLLTLKDINGVSDEVRKFKMIADKCINEPYWENNLKHNPNDIFTWKNEVVSNTSLAEAYIRDSSLVSFIPSPFDINSIEIINNDISKNVLNFYDDLELAKYLYNNNKMTFHQFCIVFFRDSKLCFDMVNQKESFDLIIDKNDEIEFLNSFKLFTEMNWPDILAQGGKGKNKTGLAFEQYHDQNYFKNYSPPNEICKFRCSQKFRTYGYRKNEIFHVLVFDLTHKLSD